MSDELGKTRRNLMVFSTGVLAVAFLEIPLNGSKFLGLDLNGLDPSRVWSGTLIALLYLVLRYWHDPAIRKLASEWKKQGTEIYQKLSMTTIENAFKHRERRKILPRVIFNISQPPAPSARPGLIGRYSFTTWRTGNVAIGWSGDDGQIDGHPVKVTYARDGSAWFRISRLSTAWLAVRTFRNMLRVSWTVLEIVVPVLLAIGATGVACFKLAQALS
ncbi:hypothetical protein [Achromobacter xylosoxidans]|uniref:hypothetical protein n=1 Tax=Alcaligenes xylosoxydans xylosoxydans TaxID=85698 RepID=UPI000AFB19E2|nr:hypothetical protein [Achromobacter xylosoxidans]